MKRSTHRSVSPHWIMTAVLATVLAFQLFSANAPTAEANLIKAADVATLGDYTVLTADGGSQDILYIIDSRTEDLLVYEVINQNQLVLVARQPLDRLFRSAAR